MSDQRIVENPSKAKIGQRSSPEPAEAATPVSKAKGKGRRPLVLVLVAVLVLGAGAAYWFVLGPGSSQTPATQATEQVEPEVELGIVQAVDPISINLADGHYLRLGLGLQLSAEVAEDLEPAKALDRAIGLFSMRSLAEAGSAEGREALKAELATQLKEAYEGEVVDVYFTTYVTQ
ncbi:flagellar basal body-associated FliL family protein [Cellulomonas endophytica]|uniref:flagellar basal body-associated FliL family protein n=1 Tax=Cellulomonas endophytica TaxID=2494735 RepID=UPI001011C725|nr:flagellar basal body-associated FliL family protein [Cellulomonas endophytica]